MKVFCIGAHKTGTTSMQAALRALGFSVLPESVWYNDITLRREFYDGRYAKLFDIIEQYDAFEDSPFNHSDFYQRLYERYPDARFILTVRDPEGVVASHKRWLATLRRTVFAADKDVEAFVEMFWRQEYGQGKFIDDEEKLKAIYARRNESIVEFFRGKSHQFLMMDLQKESHPWDKLCGFLYREVPQMDFPHLNRTK
jgi:hypothetical protein